MSKQLPIPSFFDATKADKVWQVPYGVRATEADEWAKKHKLQPAVKDTLKVGLMCIDMQNTFCLPTGALYVAGKSGTGAVDDSNRLAQFIYKNLHRITTISPTMDTHLTWQIFHPAFWVDVNGNHPVGGATMITVEDVKNGVWQVNPAAAGALGNNYMTLQEHALHYVEKLFKGGKYSLMVWPYHAMLGDVDHALVASVMEAIFFHSIARKSQIDFRVKGGNPLTENYSVLCPEVLDTKSGQPIDQENTEFIKSLMDLDVVIIAGQAKSHCVAWTIDDLLNKINAKDPKLAKKVWLLEDCTSNVVIPGVIDFSQQGDEAFDRFAKAGMNIVNSTMPIEDWPGLKF